MSVFTGVPSSYVHGSIIDGIFSGRIDLPTESYYIEKSEMYFNDEQPFHSVIYAGSDVVHDLPSRFLSISTCLSTVYLVFVVSAKS